MNLAVRRLQHVAQKPRLSTPHQADSRCGRRNLRLRDRDQRIPHWWDLRDAAPTVDETHVNTAAKRAQMRPPSKLRYSR